MTEPSPIGAIFAPGMGPVRPQLRGPEGNRHPVADFERMRVIALATKELAARGYMEDTGFIIPSGANTINKDELAMAFKTRPDEMKIIEQGHQVQLPDENKKADMTPREFLQAFPDFMSRQNLDRKRGKPVNSDEVDLLIKTTEAGLMTELIEKAHVKPGPKDRVKLTQEIIEEPEAQDTIENIVRNLNALDKKVNGVWDGTIAVVTSNFGHISRIEEILKAFGIPENKIVGLSAEQVLRHVGYNKEYLNTYEILNVNDSTLQNQERWRRGVREMPEYVLSKLALFENDERLIQVMDGLVEWYGIDKIAKFNPEFKLYKEMSPKNLREKLAAIERVKPPEEWGKDTNIEEWKNEIDSYNKSTESWLIEHDQSRTA